jgi:hypothetical protein
VVKVAKIVGEASVTDVATTLKTKLALNSLVIDGQVIETGPSSSVILVLSNGAIVNLKANSRLEINEFLQNPFSTAFKIGESQQEPSVSTTKLFLRKGEVISQVKKLNREAGSSFTVETPVGAAGIRGTAFRLSYAPLDQVGRFTLSMAEGLIRFTPQGGRSVEVAAGRELTFSADIDPVTGAVRSIPTMPAPAAVSPGNQADLQQGLSEGFGAAITIEFPPATGTGGPFATSVSAVSAVPTATPATATVEPVNNSALASPPPTPPTQRTTPGDGE